MSGRAAKDSVCYAVAGTTRAQGSDWHAEIVDYCRGPYGVDADAAVRELNRPGYRARRLEDGFPEWERAGQPVAAGGKE